MVGKVLGCIVDHASRLSIDQQLVKSYTATISERTCAALKKLNMQLLKEIFGKAGQAKFVNESYLNAILERRDQVLKHTQVVDKIVE